MAGLNRLTLAELTALVHRNNRACPYPPHLASALAKLARDDALYWRDLSATDVRFWICGVISTLADMLADNAEDLEVCEWLRTARVGDVLDTFHGEPVERVS